MILERPGTPLVPGSREFGPPAAGEVLIEVRACGVCRTDLHVCDGELPDPVLPVVPGHEIVGTVLEAGPGVDRFAGGERVGVPWLASTCGHCAFCKAGQENLCDQARFTGYTADGGYASHVIARADYVLPLPPALGDLEAAPLLCAGLIGWRTLVMAGDARRIGIYGFGAAAHIIAQVALHQGRRVHAFTREGDEAAQRFALELGCHSARSSLRPAPEPLDAALIFAPVGALVPAALQAVRKGGTVVCGGIHMSDIPSFAYESLWGERSIRSVANLTRADGKAFFEAIAGIELAIAVQPYRLEEANQALADLREGAVRGAAVLVP